MNFIRQTGFVRTGRWCGSRLVIVVLFAVVVGRCAATEPSEREVQRLRRQVEWLSESLALSRAEGDVLRARLDRNEFEAAGGQTTETLVRDAMPAGVECSVIEVNEELGMAVISAGRQNGLRPGMRLAAMRGEKVMARLRIVDVRPKIAGAVIERAGLDFPGAKDRVVVATGSKE